VEKAMRLNPRYPIYYLFGLGHAYFLTNRYEEAITALKKALNRNPNFWPANVHLAATYRKLGREDEAFARRKGYSRGTTVCPSTIGKRDSLIKTKACEKRYSILFARRRGRPAVGLTPPN